MGSTVTRLSHRCRVNDVAGTVRLDVARDEPVEVTISISTLIGDRGTYPPQEVTITPKAAHELRLVLNWLLEPEAEPEGCTHE